MTAPSEHSARFREFHSLKQEAYLQWKIEILRPFVSVIYDEVKTDATTGQTYPGKAFVTTACTQLRPFYDLFYPAPERLRMFPRNLPDLLDPFALAVWYMDDGSLDGFHPRIAFGLDDTTLRRAVAALRRLGLDARLHGTTSRDRELRFPDQADKFFNIVAPHVPACMAYKVAPVSERREADQNARALTNDEAARLSVAGMSVTDIAKVFAVGRTTVYRRLGGHVPRKMGRPTRRYDLLAAEVSLSKFEPARWGALTQQEQDVWLDDAVDVLLKTQMPVGVEPTVDVALSELAKVRKSAVSLRGNRIEPWSPVGVRLCTPFFPNRYGAASGGRISAAQAWQEPAHLRAAVRFQLEHGDPVVPHRVLRAITMQFRTPSIFRPTVARFIYASFCPAGGTVWDPCSGYGGRLLGAVAAGVRYVATDVEPETVGGNLRLASLLGAAVRVEQQPAESFDPGEHIDLVFTSPPYYNRERYSTRPEQSWVRHGDSVDAWVSGFIAPVVETACRVLKPGGRLILNVADIRVGRRVHPLVDKVTASACAAGFAHETTLAMPLAKLNRGMDPTEPVLVFRRR